MRTDVRTGVGLCTVVVRALLSRVLVLFPSWPKISEHGHYFLASLIRIYSGLREWIHRGDHAGHLSNYCVDLWSKVIFRRWGSACYRNEFLLAAPGFHALMADTWELSSMYQTKPCKKLISRRHCAWRTKSWISSRGLWLRRIYVKYRWRLSSTSWPPWCWSSGFRIYYIRRVTTIPKISVKRLARIVVTLFVDWVVFSASLNGQKELSLKYDAGQICLWIPCSIVAKTMADGYVDAFDENIVLSFLAVDVRYRTRLSN